jgi:dephospho-CoA kinase
MPLCVGLTGGIGCGKSTATDMFAELGAAIIDTDVISRDLTAPGGRALPLIVEAFGAECIGSDGALDRSRMRTLVFSDALAKKKLENILHPLIRAEARARVQASKALYSILVVPLLLETGSYSDLIDRVLVVDCDEDQQIERVSARSGLSAQEVRAIMRAQLPRAERLARADDVLVNDAGIDVLRQRVHDLHRTYAALAARRA